jgi:hypothetical protein
LPCDGTNRLAMAAHTRVDRPPRANLKRNVYGAGRDQYYDYELLTIVARR